LVSARVAPGRNFVNKQADGVWFIYTYACSADKKVHLAFLKIGGKYALGDTDVEVDEE